MKTQKQTPRDIGPGDVLGYRRTTVVVIGADADGYRVRGVRRGQVAANTFVAPAGELVA